MPVDWRATVAYRGAFASGFPRDSLDLPAFHRGDARRPPPPRMTHPVHMTPRLPGLDTLRALAIALVLMSHYQAFVSQAPTFGFLGRIGWAGVDLFFVLSGYLIGNQLLA